MKHHETLYIMMGKIKLIILLILVIGIAYWLLNKEKSVLQEGMTMPTFELPNQDNELINSSRFAGKPLVVYFYPKDDTPGCTKEACSFRDNYVRFQFNNVQVVGISADDAASHNAFATKYELPFALLADTNREVHKAFGVGKELGLMTSRVTFVIDSTGKIVKIYKDNIHAEKHITEALKALKIE